MAEEMLNKVMSAEKDAENILKDAHDEAGGLLEKAHTDAAALRLKMLEDAKSSVKDIEHGIDDRAKFSVVEAEKRSAAEAQRLKAIAEEKRGEVVKTLMDIVSKG